MSLVGCRRATSARPIQLVLLAAVAGVVFAGCGGSGARKSITQMDMGASS